jgi:hypothetical protein
MKKEASTKKIVVLLASLVFIASAMLVFPAVALAIDEGTPCDAAESEETRNRGGGIEQAKQAIVGYVAGSNQDLSAYEVASFINDNGMDYGASSIGSEYIFNPGATDYLSASPLSQTKFVVAYRDHGNSDRGTAAIGDVSGKTISFGAEYIFNPAITYSVSVSALSENKFVVAYSDGGNSQQGTARIGDVAGTAITYGAFEYLFNPAATGEISTSALPEDKFVVAFSDWGNSSFGTARVGYVSMTTIGYDPEFVFNPAATSENSISVLAQAKFAVAFSDEGNSDYGTAVVGDIAGNSITYGSEYVFNPASTYRCSTTALSGIKLVVAYSDIGNSNHGTAVVGDIAGNTITYGSEYVFNADSTNYVSVSALSQNRFAAAYSDDGNSNYGMAVLGKVSGRTISYGKAYVTNPGYTSDNSTIVLSENRFAVAFADNGNMGYGTAVIFEMYSFYFAEGYTRPGFREYLCLGNPWNAPAEATITYMFPDGTTQDQAVTVPANSRTTIDVNAVVGPDREVSAKVTADRPIVAERPIYFSYNGVWAGGHDSVGATTASGKWYFAEGYTGAGFDEYICVLNPGGTQADLTFRFQTQEEGEKVVSGLSVGPHSRASFRVNDLLGGGSYQTSLKLESSQPVVAERPMYFSYAGTGGWGWQGGHCVMGAPSLAKKYYLAEGTTRSGFEEWLTLQNPGNSAITIDATYQLGPGQGDPIARSYEVAAASRRTLFVPDEVGADKDVSVYLTSGSDFLAERPMYFSYSYPGLSAQGGHCVIGAASTAKQWFFAEGYTGAGFNEWICLQNPGTTDAGVQITYLTQEEGALPAKDLVVPAGTRLNVMVNEHAGLDYQLSCRISSDQPIVCERPMYFVYNGVWPGGHDVVGYVP